MSLRLYHADASPNALRVRAVVHELGLDPEMITVDLWSGDNRNDAFLALNPNGKVPVLVDGDLVIWESRAINAYLATIYPDTGLYPANPQQRAIIDQWSYWQAIHLGPSMQKLTMERVFKPKFGLGEPDEASIESALKDIGQLLAVLDAHLAGRDWIADDLSLADFAVASTFHTRHMAGLDLSGVPNVQAWIERMEARPSWQTAISPALAFLES